MENNNVLEQRADVEEIREKGKAAARKIREGNNKQANSSKSDETSQASTMFYLHSLLLFSGRLLHRMLGFYNSLFDFKASDKATIYRNLSNQYINRGLHEKALQYLKEWSRLEPSNPDAHYHLGVALSSGDDVKAAIRSLDKALKLSPDHKNAIYRRAGLSLKVKDYKKSVEDLEKLVSMVPKSPKPFYLLAIACDRMDEVDKAVEAMKRAIALDSEEIKYYQHLGFLYERREDHKEAAKCFTKVMELQREQDDE
ncbi:MAG TPA: tetratricopeptide repeat protein [Deltaproteobacteria bacterium]|nr:tetratricopeptide repeat protein [Deltaproteobacteria bacterium]HIJ39635.1 tetratricopeptide repeat protein [Deltaproteobacteria bacterium]